LYVLALSFQNLERSLMSQGHVPMKGPPSFRLSKTVFIITLVWSNSRQDKLAMAHYHLGIYFRKLRRKEKILFRFKKAQELSESEPALKKDH